MLPTFPINNFKPWAPPPTKPLHRTPSIRSLRAPNSPQPKSSHVLPPSTLPLPKHHLPARPPAAVCMNVSASSQPCTPSNSQTQIREISRLESEQSSRPETSEYDTASRNSVPHIPAADPNHHCNPQDDTETPAELLAFRGDYTARGLSSPSISSSNDSIEEFLRLPEAQDNNIPIDPVILADLEGWEDLDLQPHAPQADSLITTEKACPYPDPPTILYSQINHSRDPDKRVGGEGGDTQTSDHDHLPTNSRQQAHPSPHSASPKPSFLKGVHGNNHVVKPRSRKRKINQSDSRDSKRLQARSTLPLREDSFTALQSHFMSLPLDDRLQFLSWLFEGALSRCVSDTSSTACEGGEARVTCRSSPQYEMEQNPGACWKDQRSSRNRMPWSREEADLLLRLRKEEKRPWAEVTRLFSVEFPGRSPGAIQVYWSTTLSKKVN
ncbi:uncharacterized protein BDW70DRAFT_78109 [Aspergillus foveolatus]|uniref:uncharacterized protein n=1 Tax=Aspergillus foveolatus TaxID=210207 RepID=UPI003CCD34C9